MPSKVQMAWCFPRQLTTQALNIYPGNSLQSPRNSIHAFHCPEHICAAVRAQYVAPRAQIPLECELKGMPLVAFANSAQSSSFLKVKRGQNKFLENHQSVMSWQFCNACISHKLLYTCVRRSHLAFLLIDGVTYCVELSGVFRLILRLAFLLRHRVIHSFILGLAHVLVP